MTLVGKMIKLRRALWFIVSHNRLLLWCLLNIDWSKDSRYILAKEDSQVSGSWEVKVILWKYHIAQIISLLSKRGRKVESNIYWESHVTSSNYAVVYTRGQNE